MRLVSVTTKIDAEDRNYLIELANGDDRTLSFTIRKIIEDYVDDARDREVQEEAERQALQEAQIIKVKRRA